ncbi:MAG: Mth938-like domain-containing protein [Steroidobacteraceae bacterium]
MQLSLASRTDINLIRSHGANDVRIRDATFTAPLLVGAQAIVADWAAGTLDTFDAAMLEPVFVLAPEVVIVGMPAPVAWPPATVRALFGRRHIGLEVMEFGAACRTYNVLAQEDRRVVLALLP